MMYIHSGAFLCQLTTAPYCLFMYVLQEGKRSKSILPFLIYTDHYSSSSTTAG